MNMNSDSHDKEKESGKIRPKEVGKSAWEKVQRFSGKTRDTLRDLRTLDWNNPETLLRLVKHVGNKISGEVVTLTFLAIRLKDIIDKGGVEQTFDLDGFELNFFPGMSTDQIKRKLEEFQRFWREQP